MVSWALSDGAWWWRAGVVICMCGWLAWAEHRVDPMGAFVCVGRAPGRRHRARIPLPCYDRTSWHDITRRVVGEEEEMQAIFWFWFVFGAVAGMAALPHLQRIAAQVRRTLAELDQPKQPSSGS